MHSAVQFARYPLLTRNQVVEVDYGTFMDMIDERNIDVVQVEDNQILFTNKDGTAVYKTGPMDDPTLTVRSMTPERNSHG